MNSNGQYYGMTRQIQQNGQTGQQSKYSVEQLDVAQQEKDSDQNLRVQQQDYRMNPFSLPGNNTNGKITSIKQTNPQQVNRPLSPQMKNNQAAFILAKQLELQSQQGQVQAQKKQNVISVKNSVESKKKNKKETKNKDQNNSKKNKQNKQSIPNSRARDFTSQENENLQLAFAPKHIYLNLDLISSASKRRSNNQDHTLKSGFVDPSQQQLQSVNLDCKTNFNSNNLAIQVDQDMCHPNSTKMSKVNQDIYESQRKSASTRAAHYGNYFKTAKFNSTANSGTSVFSKENQDYARKGKDLALEIINKETSFASDIKRKISERNTAGHELHSQTLLSNTFKSQFQSHSSRAYYKAIQTALNSSPKLSLAEGNFYNQENALSRNTFWIEHTKAHKKLLAEHYSEEQMKECSFSPKFFANKAARKCYVATHNDFEQVNQSLNPEFHKLATDSKSSYTSLYAFKKQMGFAVPLKSAHS